MPRPVITLTTDFGEGSRYIAAMKGVILSINPEATIVDLTHSIPPQDIRSGARFLAEATRWFPDGAIHVAVVDPGVGSAREIVCCEFVGKWIICPDNGLLTNLADAEKPLRLTAVRNEAFWRSPVSRTFHGRDIMAPVAAHLSTGVDPADFGPPLRNCVRLKLPKPKRAATGQTIANGAGESDESAIGEQRVAQKIEGEVVEVDSFGNLITNITEATLDGCPRDASVSVHCDEHETVGIYASYSEQPPMTLVALIGSSGALELAIVDDSARIMLGVEVGAPVAVTW